jgi:hypothetical protein
MKIGAISILFHKCGLTAETVLPHKAVLLPDNAPSHPGQSELTSDNGFTAGKCFSSLWHSCYWAHRPSSDCINETLVPWPSQNCFWWPYVTCIRGMIFCNPAVMHQACRKCHPGLESDLQCRRQQVHNAWHGACNEKLWKCQKGECERVAAK